MENTFQLYLREQMLFKRRTYHQISDTDLIDAYRQKANNKLVEEIYYRYSHLVLGSCMKYLKNEQDAEDCSMHIFEKLPTLILRQPIDHFSSWLYRVVVNECLQTIRKTKRINETQYLDNLISEDTDEDHTANMAIGLISQFVTELKYEQQRCVTEFYLNKKSYQQIAEENDWTVKHVKSAIQNGKRNLRLKYEEHEAKNPS